MNDSKNKPGCQPGAARSGLILIIRIRDLWTKLALSINLNLLGGTMSREKDARALRRARDQGVLDSGLYIEIGKNDLPIPEIMTRSLEQLTLAILVDALDLQVRAHAFFERFGPAFDDLELCASVNRMLGLPQFGIKADLLQAQYISGPDGITHQVTSSPSLHTRTHHCCFTAAIMIAFGLRLNLDEHDIATGAFGALLHDIGHSAFGHDMDDILVKMGRPSHEERGYRIIRLDPDVQESFEMARVDTEEVIAVIEEHGQLGRLENIADTLSYVVLDSQVMNMQPKANLEFVWQLIKSVQGIKGKQYLVDDLEPLRKLVLWRADLFRDVYATAHNRIAAHVLRNFYQTTIELGMFSLRDFESGTDSEIKMRLPYAVQQHDQLPTWFSELTGLAFGFFDQLSCWQQRACESEAEAQRVLNSLDRKVLDTAFVITPSDYRRKTYQAITPDGQVHDVQAPASHVSEFYKKWYVMYLPG